MDKIGILTFHNTTNFGAILQAVATYKIMTEMGKECEILDYHCEKIDKREIPVLQNSIKKFGIKSFLHMLILCRKHHKLISFLYKKTEISSCFYNKRTISEASEKYSRFIVGSDMVWCTEYTDSDYTYMLDFVADNNKKYAFASSGGCSWNKKEQEKIKYLLNQFQVIAVREKDMSDKLSAMLEKKVWNVCDPTMLIQPEVWKTYAKKGKVTRKKYCLIYMDDSNQNCQKAAEKYGKKSMVAVYKIGLISMPGKAVKIKKAHAIGEFLKYIIEAQMLFTASYHGMLFAIYFHVPFVFFNKDSSRLINAAERLGVSERNGNLYELSEMGEIDWEKVDIARNEFALYSRKVLFEMIREIK